MNKADSIIRRLRTSCGADMRLSKSWAITRVYLVILIGLAVLLAVDVVGGRNIRHRQKGEEDESTYLCTEEGDLLIAIKNIIKNNNNNNNRCNNR